MKRKIMYLSTGLLLITFQLCAMNNNIDNQLFEEIPKINNFRTSVLALDTVKALLDQGANPNAQKNDETAVMFAIKESATTRGVMPIKLLKILIKKKYNKNVDFIANNGMTALTYAVHFGNNDFIGALFRAGARQYFSDGAIIDYLDYLKNNNIQSKVPEIANLQHINEKKRRKNETKIRDLMDQKLINFDFCMLPTRQEIELQQEIAQKAE